MTGFLRVVPSAEDVGTGVRDADAIAQGLEEALADTYRLIFKTHAVHWNVEGPLFFSVHSLTGVQYKDMFAAADDIAERIRALGEIAPSTMTSIVSHSIVQDGDPASTAGEMCRELAADHTRVAHRLHDLVDVSDEAGDPVTADMATARSAFHEKAAWMLRSIAKV